VLVRKERQRRFNDGQLRLWAVIEEAALRRPIGTTQILRDQLRHLLALTTRPNLTLQIIPAGTLTLPAPGAFTILRFGEPDLPDIVYLEHLTSALYLDKRSDVVRYRLAMNRLSTASAGPGETPQILATIIDQMDVEPSKPRDGR
jgi:hypothetical protein